MKDDTLSFVNRGDKIMISRFKDKEIENDYSMNVIDNCPVGALTSKHNRFKARV
jgi:NADH-quinone oxidoreductase subunit G